MGHYFVDYDLIPMLVYENYLFAFPKNNDLELVEKLADAAECISLGD